MIKIITIHEDDKDSKALSPMRVIRTHEDDKRTCEVDERTCEDDKRTCEDNKNNKDS